MSEKKHLPLLGKIKDAIEEIYRITNENGGFKGAMVGYPTVFSRVMHVLVSRGIVSRKQTSAFPKAYSYVWVAQSHPTCTLYKSVYQEIRDKQKGYEERSKARKKGVNAPAQEEDVSTPEVAPTPIPGNVIAGFTDQELWDELKGRGYFIEDNRLAVVKKSYLD